MNAKSVSTPFEKGTKLKLATSDDTFCNLKMYQELTGSLNHLAVFTRPDIAFAVSKLSKFNANPTTTHFKAALHVLRYLKSTRNYPKYAITIGQPGYIDRLLAKYNMSNAKSASE